MVPLLWAGAVHARTAIACNGGHLSTLELQAREGTRARRWDVDIANALCEKMKARCEIVAQDWDGMQPGLMSRKFDLIVASMAITRTAPPARAFSTKYKETVSRFVARKADALFWRNVSPAEALKGKSIGVQRGSIQAGYLSHDYKNSDLRFYDTPQAAELDLVAGRVEYIFGNMVTYFVGFAKPPEARNFAFVGRSSRAGSSAKATASPCERTIRRRCQGQRGPRSHPRRRDLRPHHGEVLPLQADVARRQEIWRFFTAVVNFWAR